MKRKICYLFIGAALCMITPMEGIAQNVDSKTERRMLRTGNEDYEKEKYTVGLSMPTRLRRWLPTI